MKSWFGVTTILLKVWIHIYNEIFEYSATNVIIQYDPSLKDDSLFQIFKLKDLSEIGYNSLRVTLVLDHDYPKSSFSVLGKLILDEVKHIRTQGLGGIGINKLIQERISPLIKGTRNFNQLRFASDYKLRHLEWNMKKHVGR